MKPTYRMLPSSVVARVVLFLFVFNSMSGAEVSSRRSAKVRSRSAVQAPASKPVRKPIRKPAVKPVASTAPRSVRQPGGVPKAMEPLDKKMIPMVQHQTIPSNMKKSPRRQHELRDIFQGSGFIEPGAGSAEPTRRRGDVIQGDIKVIPELDKASPKIAESTARGKVFPKVEVGVGWDDAPSPSGNEGEGSGHSVLGHKTTPQPNAGKVFPKVEMAGRRGDVYPETESGKPLGEAFPKTEVDKDGFGIRPGEDAVGLKEEGSRLREGSDDLLPRGRVSAAYIKYDGVDGEFQKKSDDVGVIGDTGLFKKWGDPVLRTPDGDIKPVPALSGEQPYGIIEDNQPATEGNYWKHPATGEDEGIIIVNTQPAPEGEAFPKVETEAGLKSQGLMDGGSFGLDGKGDDLGAGGL